MNLLNPGTLIDAGSSGRGWSWIGPMARCPWHWAASRAIPREHTPRALLRGSLVHAGAAHHYARLYQAQGAPDTADYLPVDEAIRQVAVREDHRRYELGLPSEWREHEEDCIHLLGRGSEPKHMQETLNASKRVLVLCFDVIGDAIKNCFLSLDQSSCTKFSPDSFKLDD